MLITLITVELFFADDIMSTDMEDIAVGPGPVKGDNTSYIYLADFGNNLGTRKNLVIHRLVILIKTN